MEREVDYKINAILILADDMRYGDFGVLGDGNARTPNLDALRYKNKRGFIQPL